MNDASRLPEARPADPRLGEIVKLAILAVGGQGGGVLTNWIVDLAERNGHAVQATSVAGVAQRTGSTIYYVEMRADDGRAPVFSLAPAEGDVDILIAAEMMEAGRAIQRGFVTPGRTVLIASTHRALATSEKIAPGDAIADAGAVRAAAAESAAQVIAFDMERMAQEAGSVISASLFGALAGSGALPFTPVSYRETIRASGRGVEASLAAFEAARAAAALGPEPEPVPAPPAPAPAPSGPREMVAKWEALMARAEALPYPAQALAKAGLRKVVDFQDLDYGAEYLDRLEAGRDADERAGGAARDWGYTATLAKYLANAMAYDDVIRVADLKTRASRFDRVRAEAGASDKAVVYVTEYVHPGAAEVVSMMPVRLARWVEARPGLVRRIDWLVNRGRRIRTDSLRGYLQLHLVAGLRSRRRALARHAAEQAHMGAWLDLAQGRLALDYALAVATLRVRRLIKGYSDTHARGLSKYDRVLEGIALVEGRRDAAEWADRLVAAALADAEGKALDGALATVRSFADPEPTVAV